MQLTDRHKSLSKRFKFVWELVEDSSDMDFEKISRTNMGVTIVSTLIFGTRAPILFSHFPSVGERTSILLQMKRSIYL
jgi:hypothetical protein